MQDFINHARWARAALARADGLHAVLALGALGVAASVGLAAGAIWLGLVLLTREACKAAARWTRTEPAPFFEAPEIVAAASLATAPALAWFVGGKPALGFALLGMLAVHGFLTAPSIRNAANAAAPLAVLGLVFAADSGDPALFAALACFLYVAHLAFTHQRAALHGRRLDAEWVRQLNMIYGEARSAAWEIDFTRQELSGGEKLADVLGRTVNYADLAHGLVAPISERALVRETLGPQPGPTRRIALEHDVACADGQTRRVRHQGFLRAAPDGTPLRLLCFTQPSMEAAEAADHRVLRTVLARTEAMMQAQARALLVLSNELGAAERAPLENAASASSHQSGDLPSRLAQHVDLLEQRRQVIADAIDRLVRAHHEAQAANLAKSQFLAGMSHELRTPLNAIIGYAEMLQEDAEDSANSTAVQDLARILTAARHLLSLINEILDLSKIEAGRMDVSVADFNTTELLEDLIETVRPVIEQNGNAISLSCTIADDATCTDPTKLRQCVLNLLSNAGKFTKAGAIDISAGLRRHHGVDQIFITVTDTGIGMSDEHMARLFQPFVQADPSITREYGGTGLGLTITRRLAQLLGGDVSVSSTLGQGARFTLHVPARYSDAALALGAAAQIDAPQGAADAPLVVVIEDEADARELAARALTRAGFAVQGVGGGEAGLALARAKTPCLILLDIFLPDRSGWRVLQSLKHDPKTRDIPVIVLSVSEDRAHALSLGAAEHMVKPADRDKLAATVMRYARLAPNSAAAIAPTSAKRNAG